MDKRIEVFKIPYGKTWFIRFDKNYLYSYRVFGARDRSMMKVLYKLRQAILTKEKSKMMLRFK